jgi:hypothetical protein
MQSLVNAPTTRPSLATQLGSPIRAILRRYGFGIEDSGARRVILLVIAITIMGLADLALTLTYMKTTGMFELNPLAREMVAIGGEPQLIRFKLLSIALGAGMLFLLRKHRIAEPASWACAGVMCLLSIHWISYNNQIDDPAVWHGMQLSMSDEVFVQINTPARRQAN